MYTKYIHASYTSQNSEFPFLMETDFIPFTVKDISVIGRVFFFFSIPV